MAILGNSDNFDGFGEADEFGKKSKAKRQERKANRQTARTERKAKRVDSRVAKKSARQERKNMKVERRLDRKDARLQGKQDRKNAKVNAKVAAQNAAIEQNEQMIDDPNIESPSMTPEMQIKATKYLESNGRTPETDTSDLAAQLAEERRMQVRQRWEDRASELGSEQGYTEDDLDDITPSEEDIEEELLQEEEDTFMFNGDPDNFLDPDTLGTVLAIGKKATDAYREKRFAKGLKYMGMTKKQWEAKQKKKGLDSPADDSPAEAAFRAAKSGVKSAAMSKATPYIIGGILILTIAGIAIYYSGKNNS